MKMALKGDFPPYAYRNLHAKFGSSSFSDLARNPSTAAPGSGMKITLRGDFPLMPIETYMPSLVGLALVVWPGINLLLPQAELAKNVISYERCPLAIVTYIPSLVGLVPLV